MDAHAGWLRRSAVLAAVAIVVLAAGVVPMPFRLLAPGELIDVRDEVRVELGEPMETDHRRGDLSETYFGVRQRQHPSLIRVLAGLIDPTTAVVAGAGGANTVPQALTDAGLWGLGISPARPRASEPEPLFEITVADPRVDPRSLALALYVFDALADLDLSADRTIVALGWLDDDGSLHCLGPVQSAADAAASVDADLVVVPVACAMQESGEGPAVVEAGSFLEAINLLETR